MSAIDAFDRDLATWLGAEASPSAPDGLHTGAIERASHSRQRPGWLVAVRGGALMAPARSRLEADRRMTYLLILGVLAVALVVAALVVAAVLPRPAPVGNGLIAYGWQGPGHTPGGSAILGPTGADPRPNPGGSCATFSHDGRWLVFPEDGDANTDLVLKSVDGPSEVRIPLSFDYSGGMRSRSWALSPDGTRVAWFNPLRRITSADGTTGSGAKTELWVTPVSGGPATRILTASPSPNESFWGPVWSPDSQRIAFVTFDFDWLGNEHVDQRTSVQVVGADGSDRRTLSTRLVDIGDEAREISWSPDGRYLAYVALPDEPDADPDPPGDVYVIRSDGSDERSVTNSEADEAMPTWSPDGKSLAYLATTEDQDLTRLVVMPMDGGEPASPAVVGPVAGSFTWAPDGASLLIVDDHGISTVDRDLEEPPTVVTDLEDRGVICTPSWQPVVQQEAP